MPITKSAKKALRTALRRKERNYARRSTVKSSLKEVTDAVSAGDATKAAAAARLAMAQVDRALKGKVLHRNTAARRKSQIAKLLVRAGAPAAPAKTKKK